MKRLVVRVVAGLVLLAGLGLSSLVFLLGAPVAAGAPFKEPAGTACFDPWAETHPGDHEPDVQGSWSWWPPGLTCVHASGEVFVEPTPEDTAAVAFVALTVLACGVVPTVLVSRGLWRSPVS